MRDFDPSQYGERIVEQSIRPLKCRSLPGQPEARSIGGCENVGNGSDGCKAMTVVNGGSMLLIFVL